VIRYLKIHDILNIHEDIMADSDELDQAGVLFEDRLLFAVERPQMISFDEEVYPTLWLKVASLVQSIAHGHPFHNGNKRTALACLHIFLLLNGFDFTLSNQEAEDFMVDIVTNDSYKGSEGVANISDAIEKHSQKLKG
jgi:death-on-curing protein